MRLLKNTHKRLEILDSLEKVGYVLPWSTIY